MRTTLYEKLFIDGFAKPSYVVVTVALERALDEADVARAALATIERHPRLRSRVRTLFTVPVAFDPRPPKEWFAAQGIMRHARADLRLLEQELLGTPIDLTSAFPLEVHLVDEPAALVIKLHHAVIDASSGFTVLHDFMRALRGQALSSMRPRQRAVRRTRDWIRRARLRPRLPSVSVTTSYHPRVALEDEPVAYVERVLTGSFTRLKETARRRGASFSELVASALLSGMARYNEEQGTAAPEEIGLMFARARPRGAAGDASFRSDTCLVSAPRRQLATPHHPATLTELRRRARETGHDEAALALFYASRKVFGRPRAPEEQRALHFTLSDLTSFGRGLEMGALRDLRVLASPTSFDHAGMIVSRFGDDVRLSIVSHRGALDAAALLEATRRTLEES